MEHYSCLAILCNAAARSPCHCCRLWARIYPHMDTKSFSCPTHVQAWNPSVTRSAWVFFVPFHLRTRATAVLAKSEKVNFVAVTVNEVLGVDLLHTKKINKWNLWNLTTSINHTEAQQGCVITLQHWALGKSKEAQIKSDLIRRLHRALLSKALRPTMH